ncbi:hypothetical protein LIA77_06430 [Sarocladium implicatum]|nr:hypothetical protein LIA77_06430 [Sarocladium implicatum]
MDAVKRVEHMRTIREKERMQRREIDGSVMEGRKRRDRFQREEEEEGESRNKKMSRGEGDGQDPQNHGRGSICRGGGGGEVDAGQSENWSRERYFGRRKRGWNYLEA